MQQHRSRRTLRGRRGLVDANVIADGEFFNYFVFPFVCFVFILLIEVLAFVLDGAFGRFVEFVRWIWVSCLDLVYNVLCCVVCLALQGR